MKIWKYGLAVVDEQIIRTRSVRRFLDVQVQGDTPCLWVQVDEEGVEESWRIRIIGTGNPMPENPGIFCGTFQWYNGALVFHAFAEFVNG